MAPRKAEKEKNQHIQVVVRLRPLNSAEKRQGSFQAINYDTDKKEITVKDETFTFDRVFGPHAEQIELYKLTVVPLIEEVLLGYSCTIFAYGHTGSGKTFTMEGERTEGAGITWENDPLSGNIPRSMSHIFSRLETMGSCVIQGLQGVVINNRQDVYSVLKKGSRRRQTAATLMNAHSSRFAVTIDMKENSIDGEELLRTGKLKLVDLAGSECVGRSGATDKRAREAGSMNQSLLTLGRVFTVLVEHTSHVPYRESKLTRLLQDSMGGRTKTSIIATVSPALCHLDETLSTLDYAHRAKNITNKPEINQKRTKKAMPTEYTEENERLQPARDKNGIYISQENYDVMQSTILQQKDSIKEFEVEIELMTSEMNKLKKELEDTKKKLEKTSKTLEVTENTLVKTKGQASQESEVSRQNNFHQETSISLISVIEASLEKLSESREKLDKLRQEKQWFENQLMENIQKREQLIKQVMEREIQNTMLEKSKSQIEGELRRQRSQAALDIEQSKVKVLSSLENMVKSEFVCAICSELFIQATTLTCSHAFCHLCIEKWLVLQKEDCPNCRQKVSFRVRSLVLDNYIDKLMEILSEDTRANRQRIITEREAEQKLWDEAVQALLDSTRVVHERPVASNNTRALLERPTRTPFTISQQPVRTERYVPHTNQRRWYPSTRVVHERPNYLH